MSLQLIERWRGTLASPPTHRWWVATRSDTIEGFIGIGPSREPVDDTLGEVDTIAVDPSNWRTGAGRVLMNRALRQLRLDGYRAAVLWTLSDYSMGRAFYKAMGWEPSGRTRAEGHEVCFWHELA